MSNNGEVIRIGRKGKKKFAIGEKGEPFEIDVILTQSQWIAIDREYRDENNRVPHERIDEFHAATWKFVRDLCEDESVTMAECLEFLKLLHEEAEKLRGFFIAKTAAEPSSPNSTELTISE